LVGTGFAEFATAGPLDRSGAHGMRMSHFNPKLNKRRVLAHEDWSVYSVNGFAVRNVARPDEEFGNFAMQSEFPDLIPKGEIWISEKLAAGEGVFFIANALTRCKRAADGATDKAYDEGLEVERMLREKLNGLEFRNGKAHKHVPELIYLEDYFVLADPKENVHVWIIDGNRARSYYKTDYTEGGHGVVYPWVPWGEIWIEHGVDRREVPFIVCHEYLERRLMRDEGLEYDRAHEICSRAEFDLRKAEGVASLLAGERRKLRKTDLHQLCNDDVFHYVLKNYVR
jgi:hypothetical protein